MLLLNRTISNHISNIIVNCLDSNIVINKTTNPYLSICHDEKNHFDIKPTKDKRTIICSKNNFPHHFKGEDEIITATFFEVSYPSEVNRYSKNTLYIDVPPNRSDLSLKITSLSSPVEIWNISMSNLFIQTVSGQTTLLNVDFLSGHIQSVDGNIFATIDNSSNNYQTYLFSVLGQTKKTTQTYYLPPKEEDEMANINIERTLNAKSVVGNIKVLFKRK